jgi:predicted amidohydrolase
MSAAAASHLLRIALVQLRPVDGDKERNLAAAGAAVAAASRAGARLVVLPEYVLTGFPAERMRELAEPLRGPSLAAFRRLAAESGVCLVANLPRLSDPADARHGAAAGGAVHDATHGATHGAARDATRDATAIFDTTVVLAPDGELLTAYDKTHLFDREKAVFTPGAALEPPFFFGGVRFGVLCCFDIELPEPARTLALRGAQCLLVPSANMKPWGEHHRAYVRSRALENHAFVAYANAVGPASGYVFEGGSCLVDPLGRVLCDAGHDETVVWADVDLAIADASRGVGDYLSERRPELYD